MSDISNLLILIGVLLVSNLILSSINLYNINKKEKFTDNVNNFIGNYIGSGKYRNSYIIFKDDTIISDLWGEQKYRIVGDQAIIGYDQITGNVDFLQAELQGNSLLVNYTNGYDDKTIYFTKKKML